MSIKVHASRTNPQAVVEPTRNRLPANLISEVPYDSRSMILLAEHCSSVKNKAIQSVKSNTERNSIKGELNNLMDALSLVVEYGSCAQSNSGMKELISASSSICASLKSALRLDDSINLGSLGVNTVRLKDLVDIVSSVDFKLIGSLVADLKVYSTDLRYWQSEHRRLTNSINQLEVERAKKVQSIEKLRTRASALAEELQQLQVKNEEDQQTHTGPDGRTVSKSHRSKQRQEELLKIGEIQKEQKKIPRKLASRRDELAGLDSELAAARSALNLHEYSVDVIKRGDFSLRPAAITEVNTALAEIQKSIDSLTQSPISRTRSLEEEKGLLGSFWEDASATLIGAVCLHIIDNGQGQQPLVQITPVVPHSAVFGPLYSDDEINRMLARYIEKFDECYARMETKNPLLLHEMACDAVQGELDVMRYVFRYGQSQKLLDVFSNCYPEIAQPGNLQGLLHELRRVLSGLLQHSPFVKMLGEITESRSTLQGRQLLSDVRHFFGTLYLTAALQYLAEA